MDNQRLPNLPSLPPRHAVARLSQSRTNQPLATGLALVTALATALLSVALAHAQPGGPRSSDEGTTRTKPQPESAAVTFHTLEIEGIDIFYRAAGPEDAPVLLLLHGFPSSSHMFRNLIPELSPHYRVIAPDYPGFGYSAQPALSEFDYSFASLADLIDRFVETLGLEDYVLYMQDYGGPVGFRLALEHPERIRGIIIQNATIHLEGWNPDVVSQISPFWNERNPKTEAPMRSFLQPETTRWQYTEGSAHAERLSPDAWTHDQLGLERPGNDAVQLQYLWNYQDNVGQYPAWQAYLKKRQPPTLIVWGKNDPFFTMAGVEALQALVPTASVRVFDAGHFALETVGAEIAAAILPFLDQLPAKTTHASRETITR